MTPDDVQAVLAYASAIDPRVRRKDGDERQLQVAAWYAQLQHVAIADGRAAVDQHYAAAAPDAIMPGTVRTLAGTTGPAMYRPLAENVAASYRLAAADPGEPLAIESGRSGREALQQALDQVASRWRGAVEARPASATGYERRRSRPAGSTAADTSKRLALQQRERGATVVDGRTDAQRAAVGKAVAICFGCAVDVPVPPGWDPTDPGSPALHCARCRPEQAREAS